MKKIIILILFIMLVSISISGISDHKIPEPNMREDKDINFLGLEWYTDYQTTIKALEKVGVKDYRVKKVLDKIESKMPYWNFLNYLDKDKQTGDNCGICVEFKKIPNVADHKVSTLDVYMMVDQGTDDTYKRNNAVKFYMAVYWFRTKEDPNCYFDLFQKLCTVYGNSISYGANFGQYSFWINKQNAVIRLQSDGGSSVYLIYMAPNATQELENVDNRLNGNVQVRRANPDDYTGL